MDWTFDTSLSGDTVTVQWYVNVSALKRGNGYNGDSITPDSPVKKSKVKNKRSKNLNKIYAFLPDRVAPCINV